MQTLNVIWWKNKRKQDKPEFYRKTRDAQAGETLKRWFLVSSKLWKKKEQEDIPLLSIVVVVVFVMIIFLYDLNKQTRIFFRCSNDCRNSPSPYLSFTPLPSSRCVWVWILKERTGKTTNDDPSLIRTRRTTRRKSDIVPCGVVFVLYSVFSDALSFFAYLRSIFSSVSISFSIFVEATCCLLFLSEFFFLVRVLPPLPESGKRNGAGRSLLPDKSRYVFTYIYIIGVFHVGSLVGWSILDPSLVLDVNFSISVTFILDFFRCPILWSWWSKVNKINSA